jgi:catechol 2,3-dioxygenase-like lactoylglutathione lyase family enzyme
MLHRDRNLTFLIFLTKWSRQWGTPHISPNIEICHSHPKRGFCGVTLAHNVCRAEEVAEVLELARKAGGKIVKPAQDTFWGGHSGYFSDPDGYLS